MGRSSNFSFCWSVLSPKKASQVAAGGRIPPARAGDLGDTDSILGWEEPLEEGMVTQSLENPRHGAENLNRVSHGVAKVSKNNTQADMPEKALPKYYPAFHQIKNHLWEIDVHNRQDLGLGIINKLSM